MLHWFPEFAEFTEYLIRLGKTPLCSFTLPDILICYSFSEKLSEKRFLVPRRNQWTFISTDYLSEVKFADSEWNVLSICSEEFPVVNESKVSWPEAIHSQVLVNSGF